MGRYGPGELGVSAYRQALDLDRRGGLDFFDHIELLEHGLGSSEGGVALANVIAGETQLLKPCGRHVLGLVGRVPLVAHTTTLDGEDGICVEGSPPWLTDGGEDNCGLGVYYLSGRTWECPQAAVRQFHGLRGG